MKRLAAALALIGLVTLPVFHANAQPVPSGTSLASGSGRFVYGQVSNFRRDQFMLDTQTGKLWQLQCLTPSDKDPSSCIQPGLIPVVYTDLDGKPIGLNPTGTGK